MIMTFTGFDIYNRLLRVIRSNGRNITISGPRRDVTDNKPCVAWISMDLVYNRVRQIDGRYMHISMMSMR
jgi:hypothetical protein